MDTNQNQGKDDAIRFTNLAPEHRARIGAAVEIMLQHIGVYSTPTRTARSNGQPNGSVYPPATPAD